MDQRARHLFNTVAFLASFLLLGSTAHAQLTSGTDNNLSQKANFDSECAISHNPTNKLQLFALCNSEGPGLFAVRSIDGGATWTYPDPTDKTIADGDAGQGAPAFCDPNLAWDSFGNLFITYIGAANNTIETVISTDGGETFTNLATFGPASVDQPSIAVANTTGGTVFWVVWNQSNNMVARGASVRGLGAANIVSTDETPGSFNALQAIPGANFCSFGDVAVAPDGAVVQVCQNPMGGEGPASIIVNTDTDGLGPNNFGAAVTVTTTEVGGFERIPAQNSRTVGAEAGLAFDNKVGSPHFGRLYLVYTDETAPENSDTNILLRWSDDNGATWPGGPIQVNDDKTNRSQFLPRIAVNSDSGNIAICWLDARASDDNNKAVQQFCAIANRNDFPPNFIGPNIQVSDGASTSPEGGNQFGDYAGLTYFMGVAHTIWADTSNSTGNNPNTTLDFDVYTDRVMGGTAAQEGDPHLTTVDGIHYDFQGAGEYVSLKDGGTEIQTRQTPISTTFFPGPNRYTDIASCVSVNSAVAARVGKHRVTYQPNLSGVPDPSGMQLRVDGTLTTVPPSGIDLGDGGRITSTSHPGGLRIDFPDGTILYATPGFWARQGKWYLNVDVLQTFAVRGLLGALARGSWLPALPDGSSVGPKPASVTQRYDDLYHRLGDAWRVTDKTSLFDYASGTSTATFTLSSWPTTSGPCNAPDSTPAPGVERPVAERACRNVVGKNRHDDCVFDVMVTGELGFADTYLGTQNVVGPNGPGSGPAGPDVNNPPTPDTNWAIFFDAGANFPHGTFASVFDPGFSFNAGLEYLFTPQFSGEGIFGYHRLRSPFGGTNLFQLSGNAKVYLTAPPNKFRPFLNGGVGAYVFSSGTTKFGGNVGGGLLYEVTPNFVVQGSYNYHAVSTAGNAFKFSTVQGGVRFRF